MFRTVLLLALAAFTLPAQANDIFEYSRETLNCLNYSVSGKPEFPFKAALINGYRRGQLGEFFVSGLRTYDLQKSTSCPTLTCPTSYQGHSDDGSSIKFSIWKSGETGPSGKRVEGSVGYRAFICDIK